MLVIASKLANGTVMQLLDYAVQKVDDPKRTAAKIEKIAYICEFFANFL